MRGGKRKEVDENIECRQIHVSYEVYKKNRRKKQVTIAELYEKLSRRT